MYNTRIRSTATLMLCLSLLTSSSTHSYFSSVSLFSSHAPSCSSSMGSSHHHSSTIFNNVTIKEEDQLSAKWLLRKSLEGPIEELNIVKKNRGFYEELVKSHIRRLYEKRATRSGFGSNKFVACAFMSTIFTIFSLTASKAIVSDLLDAYHSANPESFPLLEALVAAVGPVGATLSLCAGYKAVAGYQDRVDIRIVLYQNLLEQLQAMA